MRETIDIAVTYVTSILQMMGPFSGILLVLLESIFPILPLGVFIALNINAFGFLFGFILSWMATVLGCIISFYFCRHFFSEKFLSFISRRKSKNLKSVVKRINKIKFTNLVILIALPFTPAFLINITSGLSNMNHKKFIAAIMISKIFVVYFWGYIGKSLLESMTDIKTLITISIMLVVAYFLSKLVGNKLKIE